MSSYLAKTVEERARTGAYVGYCLRCERMVAASVDEPDDKEMVRKNATFVADLVRRGFRVEHLTVADVREARWCECVHRKRKASAQVEAAL